MERNDDGVSSPAEASLFGANRSTRTPDCPDCGSRLLVAEQSRFSLTGRIDNFWACDDCGAEFATSIEVKRRAVA